LEVFVGTSGWSYYWNPDGLDWYVSNSGLNAVELNMSFFRIPFSGVVKSWALRGCGLRWSVKVNRLITHVFRFGDRALKVWERFKRVFKPLDDFIDFYLFQLPPSMTPKMALRIERFVRWVGLDSRFALEVRNISWFRSELVEWARSLGITWVSIDSPDFPLTVYNTSGFVYERMHGRSSWYSHLYSDGELSDVRDRILRVKPRRVYVFFNNDHGMLVNSRVMLKLFRESF